MVLLALCEVLEQEPVDVDDPHRRLDLRGAEQGLGLSDHQVGVGLCQLLDRHKLLHQINPVGQRVHLGLLLVNVHVLGLVDVLQRLGCTSVPR